MDPCTQLGYHHLARYPKTTAQLRQFLTKKWFDAEEIDLAVDQLTTLMVLDDRLYAELYLDWEVTKKWKPLMVVKNKLYQKGVDSSIVTDLIEIYEEVYTQGQQNALAKLWESKKEADSDDKWIKRMIGRGYGYTLVRELVGESE